MILSASSLSTAQRCPRRWRFEADPVANGLPKWHPRDLFAATLRRAVFELSNGDSKAQVASRAITRYREAATRPGIEAADPWIVAGDYCAALTTTLEAICRLTLLALEPGPLIDIGRAPDNVTAWQVASFLDQSGELHRWAVLDRLDDDSLFRELHSWAVFGDMAAADAPMTLHVVELGSFRDGRLRSPWARTFKHPAIANHYRFQTKSGGSLAGKWSTVWYQDAKQDPIKWVDLMAADNLSLISHHQLKQLSPNHISLFRTQALSEFNRLIQLPTDWSLIPMSRPACDFPSVCPWQDKCYASS